jgi:hypothetical protein
MTIQQFNTLDETGKIVAIMEDGKLFAQNWKKNIKCSYTGLVRFS